MFILMIKFILFTPLHFSCFLLLAASVDCVTLFHRQTVKLHTTPVYGRRRYVDLFCKENKRNHFLLQVLLCTSMYIITLPINFYVASEVHLQAPCQVKHPVPVEDEHESITKMFILLLFLIQFLRNINADIVV